jgi:uracil-DNA glycosylase
MSDARALLHAYLRQRAEMGETELVMEPSAVAALRRIVRPPSVAPMRPDAARRERPAAAASPAEPSPRTPPPPGVKLPPRAAAAAAVSPPAVRRDIAVADIEALPTLEMLGALASGCGRCGLAGSRRQVVFGEGRTDAEVMVVGEAPGAEEDRSGRPFVGRAGKLLDQLLLSAGFEREQVYVCNVLKCRPPSNRDPSAEEIEACSPYLLRQVDLVRPRVILAFGAFAARTLLATEESVGRLRRREHAYHGVPLIPTYHPAACLRSPAWIRSVWEDLQRARALLGVGQLPG